MGECVLCADQGVVKLQPVKGVEMEDVNPFKSQTVLNRLRWRSRRGMAELDVLFVSLGCPKQEKWMHLNAKTTYCMNIGVGAAFDFLSKTSEDIPNIIHKYGFGWLYRFLRNPIRLFKRYFIYGSHFLLKILIQKTKIK